MKPASTESTTPAPAPQPPAEAHLPYYDASEFRSDLWNEFKRLTAKLDRV